MPAAPPVNAKENSTDWFRYLAGELQNYIGTMVTILTSNGVIYTSSSNGSFSSYSSAASAINTAINQVSNLTNGGCVLVKAGSYSISTGIIPKSNVTLMSESLYGAKLAATSAIGTAIVDDTALYTQGSPLSNFRISGFEIDGTNFPATYNAGKKGINGEHWVRCRIDNNYVHNCPASGIGIDSLERVSIDHNVVEDCGTSGQIVGSNGLGIGTGERTVEHVLITNNITKGTQNVGIMLEELTTGTGEDRSYIVTNNTSIGDNKGISISGCQKVIVANNAVYNPTNQGIRALDFGSQHATHFSIIGNIIDAAQTTGILIHENCSQFVCSDNIVRNGAEEGIICRASKGKITNNIVADNGFDGIFLGSDASAIAMSDLQIIGNMVYNSADDAANKDGIRIDATNAALSDFIVTNNRCYDDQMSKTQRYGIVVTGNNNISNILISQNDVNGNGTAGIFFNPGGTVTGLQILNNAGYNPVGGAGITVTASPMTYTASYRPEVVYVIGGTITTITKGGRTIVNAATNVSIPLDPNQAIVVTYTGAPTMEKDVF